jgi:hypothetical protein
MTRPIPIHHPRGRLVFLAAFPGLAGIAAVSLAVLGSAAPNHIPPLSKLTSTAGPQLPLKISPDPISLGTLDPGRSAVAKLTLRNSGSDPVIVARVETSCPCLTVAEQSTEIGPGQAADLTMEFDPADDPDFRGGLSIDVIGRDPLGGIVFRTRAQIEVRAQPGEPANRLSVGRPDPEPERGAP